MSIWQGFWLLNVLSVPATVLLWWLRRRRHG
jgi:hypothetical protein